MLTKLILSILCTRFRSWLRVIFFGVKIFRSIYQLICRLGWFCPWSMHGFRLKMWRIFVLILLRDFLMNFSCLSLSLHIYDLSCCRVELRGTLNLFNRRMIAIESFFIALIFFGRAFILFYCVVVWILLLLMIFCKSLPKMLLVFILSKITGLIIKMSLLICSSFKLIIVLIGSSSIEILSGQHLSWFIKRVIIIIVVFNIRNCLFLKCKLLSQKCLLSLNVPQPCYIVKL